MKVLKWNSTKEANINLSKYKFDLEKKVSKGQKQIQDFLLIYIPKEFIYQEVRIPGSLKRLDLFISSKNLIIEYSPKSHHGTFNPFFHKNRLNYLKAIKSDAYKYEWAQKNNFNWIEMNEDDLPVLSYEYFVEKFNVYL